LAPAPAGRLAFRPEDAIDVAGGATELVEEIRSVADQTADLDKKTGVVDCG